MVTGENEIELLEVKSGRQQRKTHAKQMEKIQKIKTYLSTDISQDLYVQGQTVFRSAAHAEVKHHRNEINNLIMQAYEKEFAWSEVEKGLIYFVEAPINSDELSEASSQAIKTILQSKVHSPRIVMLNTAKFSNRAYYPFILSLNDPNVIFDFYVGKIIINVIVDLVVLKEKLAIHKLVASYLTKPVDHLEISSMDNKNGKHHIITEVGYHILGRLFFDFLSLEWLIDEILYKVHTLGLTQVSH